MTDHNTISAGETFKKVFDNIDIGDHVEVIPSRDGILLKPSSKTNDSGFLTDN